MHGADCEPGRPSPLQWQLEEHQTRCCHDSVALRQIGGHCASPQSDTAVLYNLAAAAPATSALVAAHVVR